MSKLPIIDFGETMELAKLYGSSFIIKEGLIYSYPIDSVVNSISKVYNMLNVTQNAFKQSLINIGNNGCQGVICQVEGRNETKKVLIGIETNDLTVEKLNSYMNKYGYILASKNQLGDISTLCYEKRFDNDVSYILHMTDKLYHICKLLVAEKALNKGLTPHTSKWPQFQSNDERVYAFYKKPSVSEFHEYIRSLITNKQCKMNDSFAIVSIDTKILNDMGIKLYHDPRIDNAVYMHESVPASALEIADRFIQN